MIEHAAAQPLECRRLVLLHHVCDHAERAATRADRRECARLRSPVSLTLRETWSTDPEVPIAEYAPSRPGTPGGPQGPGPRAGRPARPSPARGPRAHTGDMRRIIGTIVGAILAISLAFTAVGRIVATLKMFLIIGLIAIAVVIIVWLVA